MASSGYSQLELFAETAEQMSDQVFDFKCSSCERINRIVEAVKYCEECREYCCQSCTDAHTMLNHNLISKGQQSIGQQAGLPEFPTVRCIKHKGNVVDTYCAVHDGVGCCVCFLEDHKNCDASHIHSIPDKIDTIFKLSDCKQTYSLVKDMIESMQTVTNSKDTQLQTLTRAKKEALDEVTTFQKELEAIVRKAAESSRQVVDAVYKDLENEILQEKHNAENICEDLQTTYEKLKQSEGNRAQRFVYTKGAQEKIKEAQLEKMKQDIQHNTATEALFIPEQSLMEYVKDLKVIGQVQRHRKRKDDLYKVKGIRDICMKLSDDAKTCHSEGCCLTHDSLLLVTDANNKKLKRIDIQKMSVVDYCSLDFKPYGVCCVSKHEVAVACNEMIQFVSIESKMIPTGQIPFSGWGYGIAFNEGKLCVAEFDESLYVYDMNGTLLKTIPEDNAGNKLFNATRRVIFNESGKKIFLVDSNDAVVCFDDQEKYLFTITGLGLSHANGVCVDGRGNLLIVGHGSHNVVQCSEYGKKVGVVVKKDDGIQNPLTVCFHQELNKMFVTMAKSNVVKMYELE